MKEMMMNGLFNKMDRVGALWGLVLVISILAISMSYGANTYYVTTNGSDSAAGTSWATALATISNAMTRVANGDTVMLSNGTFNITAQIELTNAVTFTSTNGWEYTTVDAGNVADRRVFYMTNANAVIDGVSITRGNGNASSLPNSSPDTRYEGGGVWMSAGLVENCSITNNSVSHRGAGIYMEGGTVTNCIITKQHMTESGSGLYLNGSGALVTHCTIINNSNVRNGAGLYITSAGGTVRNCTITKNIASAFSAGGVYMVGGVVENCLVTENQGGVYPSDTGGGGIYMNGGIVRFCTVADNIQGQDNYPPSSAGAGGIFADGGAVTNCVIYNNTSVMTAGGASDIAVAGATVTYSCAPELTNGTGNTIGNPQFEDRATGNYRLAPASSCIDAGTNIAGVVTDLEGSTRPTDGDGDSSADPDMGCYEAPAATGGDFRCNFTAPVTEAVGSLDVNFTATVYGPQTNGLYYWWDYDNDGNADEEGADKRVVSHTYSPGIYSVLLTVSNSNNDVTNHLKTSYINVYASHTYVSTNGANTSPFATWATAADNIQDAVDVVADGGTVTVSNGTYGVTAQITLTKDVTVQSANGAPVTIVKKASGTTRLFNLTHADAVLDGFTLKDSDPGGVAGGAIYMIDGTVMNCTITNCRAADGGGIYMEAGTVTNCTIIKAYGDDYYGGGVYMTGGLVVDSDIMHCCQLRYGAAAYMTGGELCRCRIQDNGHLADGSSLGSPLDLAGSTTVRNCLIMGNRGGRYENGGGVRLNHADARIENCTIVGNEGTNSAGGIQLLSGEVLNCIVYGNKAEGGVTNDIYDSGSGTTIGYTCSPDVSHDPSGTGNITNAPQFVDYGSGYGLTFTAGDYHLAIGSPCRDAATNIVGIVVDLEGATRPQGNGSDMGCYEATPPPPAGTIISIR